MKYSPDELIFRARIIKDSYSCSGAAGLDLLEEVEIKNGERIINIVTQQKTNKNGTARKSR